MGKVDGQCEVPLRLPLRSRNHLTYRNPAAFPEVTSSVSNHLNRIKTSCPHLPLSVLHLRRSCPSATGTTHILLHHQNQWLKAREMSRRWVQVKQYLWTDVMNSAHREPIQILCDRVCCTLRGCLNSNCNKND